MLSNAARRKRVPAFTPPLEKKEQQAVIRLLTLAGFRVGSPDRRWGL